MICKKCLKELIYSGRGRPPKYCKECAYKVDKYKKMMRMRRLRSLGESTLWEHRYKPDKKGSFEREIQAIRKEKKRIGI